MRPTLPAIACGMLLLVSVRSAAADDLLWLVRDGRPLCTIVHGQDDQYAAQRLQRWFADTAHAKVETVASDAQTLPKEGCLVLLGSAASNPAVRRLAAEVQIDVGSEGLTEQGYIARRVRKDGRDYVLLAGGGRDGTNYAVVDLIHWTLRHDGGNVSLGPLDAREIPRFKYRWFWNWDHRMDWGGPGRVGTVMGGGGTFSKEPQAFLIDFKRCVDYMADHKFNGLIIWGFIRDTHGGIAASQELCRYASQRGVRILPGVGTSDYGGYYFEGNHLYNADTWLAKHPELRSIKKDGSPRNSACPSKPENKQWLDEGAKWLFDTFEIGGVNLEMGDFYVCYCDDCKKARAAIQSKEPDYYKDMAISHMVTFETMRRIAPKAWLSYATYTGYTAAMMKTPPKFLDMIPQDAICQWTLTHMARKWPADVRPMAKHNLGYLHWCNTSTHTQDDFYLADVRDICREAASVGFEGLDTYGELSPEQPNVELFYLAWEAFLWNPQMSIDEFVEERLAPLWGGREPALAILKIIPLIKTAKLRKNPENLTEARRLVMSARAAASPNGRARWDRLIAYLERQQQAEHVQKTKPAK